MHGTILTIFSEDDVTDFLASDWWRGSSENLRKVSARARESSGIFGKGSGIVGNLRQGKRKTQGGVGGGRQERKREGWVGEGQKVWRVGWVMTSSKK